MFYFLSTFSRTILYDTAPLIPLLTAGLRVKGNRIMENKNAVLQENQTKEERRQLCSN